MQGMTGTLVHEKTEGVGGRTGDRDGEWAAEAGLWQ